MWASRLRTRQSERLRRWHGASCLLLAAILLSWTANNCNANYDSLYKPEDGLLELNVTNFNASVYNQPTAFIIEFYSSWCGHCRDYAPYYVEFAKLLKSWKSVVVTAVLNCADESNALVCRAYRIDAFPTLRYFRPYSKPNDDSKKYMDDKKNLTMLSLFVSELIKVDFDASRPVTWPNYEIIPDTQTSLSQLWTANDASLLCVVVENDPIKNGYALITNYAEERRLHIAVMRPAHPIAIRFGGVQLPAVHIFSRKNPERVLFSSNSKMTWVDMKTQVEKFLALEPPPLQQQIQQPISDDKQRREHGVVAPPEVAAVSTTWTQYEVQLLDLQKAMLYMLMVEVPRNTHIKGAELSALRGWIHLLRRYAPGTAPMRRLFYRLDEWLKRSEFLTEITADNWLKTVERIQSDLGRPLPTHSEYMACRGSEFKFRGYTCGLWTLFHSITVQAYKEEKNNMRFKPYDDVLEPIHQFIVQFLSCESCAKHFDQMTRDRNMAATNRPEDVVLWLWSAHNIVNKRLSGDATDDPKFPKRQFPPSSVCLKCYIKDGVYDEQATLTFLVNYYTNIKFDGIANQPEYNMKKFDHGKLESVEIGRLNPKFKPMAGKVDNLEEMEERFKRQENKLKGEWKKIDENDFMSGPSPTDRKIFYLLWILTAVVLFSLYYKYHQNRSKFWKTFYYYSDYKLCWRRGRTLHSSIRKFQV